MSDERPEDDANDARLASLVQFGFPEDSMRAFLEEHEGGRSERLTWLEDRRETAAELRERIDELSPFVSRAGQATLDAYVGRLGDPFSVEDVLASFDRDVRTLASWEPEMSRAKSAWIQAGEAEVWQSIFGRLGRLDVSSHAALSPLHRLFAFPERVDELMRHLEMVEEDERRQIDMIEASAQRLRESGYPVEDLTNQSMLDALQTLESWQAFHANKEHVRLGAVQLIGPFDEGLATEFERRCHAMQRLDEREDLEALEREINDLAQTLEQRRRVLSEAVQTWRDLGIVFPHEGELRPSDLMEWEANHDNVSASVASHLEVVERWKKFAKHWPANAEGSRNLIGHLDRTQELRNIVDEMDGLWKQLELDGLDLVQSYEHAGLNVGAWRQRVFDDPKNAMERMTIERERWDARVRILGQLDELDVSFEGADEVEVRRELLGSDDVDADVIEEMEGFVGRMKRRNERHRVMLEEELAAMRRTGGLERESSTTDMTLRELEHHVAALMRSNGAEARSEKGSVAASRMLAPLMRELSELELVGWMVKPWIDAAPHDTLRVARALSEARPHLNHHDALRRRLRALPWERDVALGLEVELLCRQPQSLERLTQHIPHYTAHLAKRPVEDEAYVIQLWQPQATRPTLVPRPEQPERPVLQPSSALEEAHEAMLEAMDATDGDPALETVDSPRTPEPPQPTPIESNDPVEPGVDENSEPAPQESSVMAEEPPPRDERDDETVAKEPPLVEVVETEPPAPVQPSGLASKDATEKALRALAELTTLLGMNELAESINARGQEALADVRRSIASEVNVAPRDVRIGRMLRLVLRLLPAGDGQDDHRAKLLAEMVDMIPVLKRWMRRRLEARHSGAKGNFLNDAAELGEALERIPGLGRRVPLEVDEQPLPTDMAGLASEVQNLARSVHLPSAGGVKA